MTSLALGSLPRVAAAVIACERCPRLRAYCPRVARERKRAVPDQVYWGGLVPALPRGRDPAALAGARGRDPRPDRSRALAARGGLVGEAPARESPALRARRRVHASRRDEARLLVSPEPPEHQHRPPHSAD